MASRTARRAGLVALGLAVLVGLAARAFPFPAGGEGENEWKGLRHQMVEEQIRGRAVRDRQVLSAMEDVPRHLFVPAPERPRAYGDQALPIGRGQTISQPYIVALMTSLLDLGRGDRVLEVGTGSGYHAAVLSRVAGEVYSIEIVPELAEQARATLTRLGYGNVHVRAGDGYQGWPEQEPFDAILLTAAPPRMPSAGDPLLRQLKTGGRMVVPVGRYVQDLMVLTKRADGTVQRRKVLPVRFVPMTGEVQQGQAGPGLP